MNISVVIPARNDLGNLRKCIDYIEASEIKPSEIIVVDDASDSDLKDRFQDRNVSFVKLDKQSGPARARNVGVETATGDVILFIDTDVFIHKDTIGIINNEFANNGENAVVGVFDDFSGYKSFFGDYKNLWMKYSYEVIPERAPLFYTSLAAIRKEVFVKTGGFNENYNRPSTEDTAYGNILWNNDIRPLIKPEVKAVHNKEYSLYGILKTDFYRASDLLKMKLRNDMGNIQEGNRSSVPSTFILSVFSTLMSFLLFFVTGNSLFFLLLLLSILLNSHYLVWLFNRRGLVFAFKSATFLPLDHLIVIAGMTVGLFSYLSGKKY
jgi:glycosyltransferase involved in cell wall biosynthesis